MFPQWQISGCCCRDAHAVFFSLRRKCCLDNKDPSHCFTFYLQLERRCRWWFDSGEVLMSERADYLVLHVHQTGSGVIGQWVLEYTSSGSRPTAAGIWSKDIGSNPATRGILLLTMCFDLVMGRASDRLMSPRGDEGIKKAATNWQLQGLDWRPEAAGPRLPGTCDLRSNSF